MKSNKSPSASIREQFEAAARLQRRDPNELLTTFMRECLEIWEDQRLDRAIAAQARRSGRRARDAVQLVRDMRQGKRQRRGKP